MTKTCQEYSELRALLNDDKVYGDLVCSHICVAMRDLRRTALDEHVFYANAFLIVQGILENAMPLATMEAA